MAVVGYRRVSSASQSLDRQELEGCDKVFEEKMSGAKRDRPELKRMLDYIRDILRSLRHLIQEVV